MELSKDEWEAIKELFFEVAESSNACIYIEELRTLAGLCEVGAKEFHDLTKQMLREPDYDLMLEDLCNK